MAAAFACVATNAQLSLEAATDLRKRGSSWCQFWFDRAVLSFDFTHPENNHTAVNKPMPAQRFFIVAALAI
jgi:hypothetical protein